MKKKKDLRYLKRSLNLKSRRYFIETDYINGVVNHEGEQVMRALNREEKEWLNQFYKETVNASPEKLYTDKEEKKKIYNENNARNRDVYIKSQMTNKLEYMNNDINILEEPEKLNLEHMSEDEEFLYLYEKLVNSIED